MSERIDIGAGDLLDRLTGGDRLRPRCTRHRGAGEYDGLHKVSRRTWRRLCGAGYVSRRGEALDVLASAAGMTCDEFLSEYVRLALLAMAESRRAKYRRCYRRRSDRATAAGFETFWRYRQTKGWT